MDFNGLHIIARPLHSAPFSVQALVEEEDTHRVLGAYHEFYKITQTTKKLVTEMLNEQPDKPGCVLLTGKYPKRLLAIVHDLEQDPSWRVEWVDSALQELFRIVGREGFHSIGIPILGGVHGRISPTRFIKLLRDNLDQWQPECLERIWLILPPGVNCRLLKALQGMEALD